MIYALFIDYIGLLMPLKRIIETMFLLLDTFFISRRPII